MSDPEFRQAYEQHKDTLYRFAWRMTGSPTTAEDLVQDCFLTFFSNAAAYDPRRGPLRGFLIGVTRNLALKQLRGERSIEEWDEEDMGCQTIDTEGRECAEIVARAVAALPPLQRETLILAEYEEMTLSEIGRVVGADLAAVKSRLSRARETLRCMLAPLLGTGKPGMKGTVHGTH
jgi:RNA polymerase sigma-70 factor (ECF subfamily)